MVLTEAEIALITHRKRHKAQAAAMADLGIQFMIRPDGSLIVLRAAVEKAFGMHGDRVRREPEPNWSACNA